MKYYLAPLEGITSYIYRNAYHSCFRPMDKYFTPFLVPHEKKGFNNRELNEILPEHNCGLTVIPQILTNRAEDFIRTAKKLKEYGYKEINLNLGCPSGTVVSKNRGAGFLALPEELERFLDEIFRGVDIRISIKTRIGKDDPEEFYKLLEIYNQYPMEELIIHPRLQREYYKGSPHMDIFSVAMEQSQNTLCYNGDITAPQDYRRLTGQFQELQRLMLGRGVISNPGLVFQIEAGREMSKQQLQEFHDRIYQDYQEIFSGGKNVLFKMKELWSYMIHIFTNPGKYAKRIKKAERQEDYEKAVLDLFLEQELRLHEIEV